MSKTGLQAGRVSDVAAAQALALFEESLDLLEQHQGIAQDDSEELPALPFVNLLEQCEAMLDAQPAQAGSISLLVAMPGVPALHADWWPVHFAGLRARQLTQADAHDPGFAAWAAAVCEGIGSLVLTATPDVAVPQGVSVDAMAFVVCHPYVAFQAHALTSPEAPVATLSDYCRGVMRTLDALDGVVTVQIETLENPVSDLRDSLGLPASVTELLVAEGARTGPHVLPPYFMGGLAYETLCARLGYDATSLPDAVVTPTYVAPAAYQIKNGEKRCANPAIISKFLARAAQVHVALATTQVPFDASVVVAVLDACAAQGSEEFLDAFDTACDQLSDSDAALACLGASAHFYALGDRLLGLNFVGNALLRAPLEASWLRVLAAAAYSDMNDGSSAFMALASEALSPGVLDDKTRTTLSNLLDQVMGTKVKDHGHILLLDELGKNPPPKTERARVMIEIGTTRELVVGQGSTQKLAGLCAEHGISFITVDMDPRNTRNAARMFAREGLNCQAVTSKGEDFLAQYDGMIDYVFLDAYDFDHGNHSEVRQDRYQKFLGGRIEEEQCHQMHLECAEALIGKMAPDGLICFDDTWTTPEGAWTAKGTTAMPYLLENGFELIEARNNAALLRSVVAQT